MAATTRSKPPTKAQIRRSHEVQAAAATAERKRDEINQNEANTYGVPLEVWKHLTPEQKRDFARTRPKNYVAPQDRGVVEAERHEELTGKPGDLDGFEGRLRSRVLSEKDKADWTEMFDPVIDDPRFGLVHPGVSKVPRRQMDEKWSQGFRFDPEAPLMPEPTIPCGMRGLLTPVCPFMGHPDKDDPTHSEEVELHQQSRHPSEVRARAAQLERQERQMDLELRRAQIAAIERQNELMARQGTPEG